MANIFATGHGLIGSYLARKEQEDKFKRQQQALADFMSGGVSAQPVQPAQQPAQRPIMAPVDPQVESMPAYQRNAVVDSYTDAGKKAGFLEYKPSQPEQPAQPSLQQPPGYDWINQAVAGLIKKGVPFQQAHQLASQMHQQKTAEYTQQRNNQEFPKLREGLANAIRSNDRASAVSAILQIQQMGGKVPTELIQWAAPNYQSKTNDLGDREVNSAFNPATGQYTVWQAFTKGQSPDSAARLALDYSKFNYQRDRDVLGDQGKTWQSKGGKDKPTDVDPKDVAEGTNKYRKKMDRLIKNEDGSYRTRDEITTDLSNANLKRELAALAAAAGISPEQLRNDISYIQSRLNQ